MDRVRALKIVTVRGSGSEFRSAEVQGWSPDKVSRAPHEETLVADFHGQRVSYENRTGRPDGSTRWRRFIYAGGDRAWVEFTSRMADWRPHPRAEEDRRELFRRIPHYLLLEAADNAARLRRLPDTSAAGRRLHVLAYRIPGRTEEVQLLIEAESALLAGIAQRVDFLGIGDATAELAFQSWGRHAALGSFPAGHELRVNGVVAQQVLYHQVGVNDPSLLTAFEIPEAMRGFTATRLGTSDRAEDLHLHLAAGLQCPFRGVQGSRSRGRGAGPRKCSR